ncbi:MAG: glycosyl hydrolase family 28 protein [Bacteroidota bacterium]
MMSVLIRSVTPVIALLFSAGCQGPKSTVSDDPWRKAEEIVQQIQLPEIPEQAFYLSDFGGNGDGRTDNKPAFDRLIGHCSAQGGGKIIVEPGEYLINGPIHLKSHINLHLQEGAKLVFGNDPDLYLPVVLTSWEGTRLYNYSPFIYAIRAKSVAITGKGEIDGEASGTWNLWKQLQDPDKKLLRSMNNRNIPLEERIFGDGHYLRPHLIQFYECENIVVEDVKISDSPFWCLHFIYSKNITVRSVSYEAFNYNNDGIDPESSENVLIENILFNNRDDNIAIKAGRDLEARTLGRASKNIVVRNCKFKGHNAIAVGSEMSGGVHDLYVEDCSFAGKVIYGIYLKGNRDRGGMVHDIYARNIEFDTTRSTIIIDSNYKNQGSCCPPLFKNVHVENVRSSHSIEHGIYLKGSPQMHLDSITLRDVTIGSASTAVEISYMDHLVMAGVMINGEEYTVDGGIPEWIKGTSPETGREVWQITSDTAASVACYFERQPFTSDEEYVVFSSQRSGKWRLYRMDLGSGVVKSLTSADRNVFDDDYTIMPDGKRVCYLDGWKLYATNVESRREELLFDYTGLLPDTPRYTGSFTNDGRFTLVYLYNDTLKAIYRTDLETGEVLEVHRHREGKISHPLLNPEDPDVITYVPGPDTQNDMSLPMEKRARSWKVDLKAGSDKQFLTVPYGYRATHESWSSDGKRFFFFRKTRPGWSPVAICSMNKEGDDLRVHYENDTIKLGHGVSSRDGHWFVSDSQEPDKNELVLLNLENGEANVLCWPNSSVDGGHTRQAHVHPSFSPGGRYICYTSDRTGVPQVYVVPVGDLTRTE